MKFKKGDKVKIIKCTGKFPTEYAYGGTSDVIPLGTMGVVWEYINPSLITIHLPDNRHHSWEVSPEEIELAILTLKELVANIGD